MTAKSAIKQKNRQKDEKLSLALGIISLGGEILPLKRNKQLLKQFDEIILASNKASVLNKYRNHPRVTLLKLKKNYGVAGNRDILMRASGCEVMMFLDDDACFSQANLGGKFFASLKNYFLSFPKLAVLALPVKNPSGKFQNWYLARAPQHPLQVSQFLGGACLIRKQAYLKVGGFCINYRYGAEESNLAWRMIDQGYKVVQLPCPVVTHHSANDRLIQGKDDIGYANMVRTLQKLFPTPLAQLIVFVISARFFLRQRRLPAPGRRLTRFGRPAPQKRLSYTALGKILRLRFFPKRQGLEKMMGKQKVF